MMKTMLLQIMEKERKALLEKDPAISQAKWRQKMIVGLPKLFDMIYFLFQSIRRSVITKEELMHKIVSSHLDIVDRSKSVSLSLLSDSSIVLRSFNLILFLLSIQEKLKRN